MNGLAERQLIELAVMVLAACVYIVLHYLCSGLAIAISGQKTGIIRGFLQGTMLCCVFAAAGIFILNGAIKWYHVLSYGGFVMLFTKMIHFIKKIIKSKVKKKNN